MTTATRRARVRHPNRVAWELDTLIAVTVCNMGERALARRYARQAGQS